MGSRKDQARVADVGEVLLNLHNGVLRADPEAQTLVRIAGELIALALHKAGVKEPKPDEKT